MKEFKIVDVRDGKMFVEITESPLSPTLDSESNSSRALLSSQMINGTILWTTRELAREIAMELTNDVYIDRFVSSEWMIEVIQKVLERQE